MKYSLPVFLILCFILLGCEKKESPEPGVLDYLTGAEHLKTYKKTKSKIEDINKSLEDRNQEIE